MVDPLLEQLNEIPDPAVGLEERTAPDIKAPAEPSRTGYDRCDRWPLSLLPGPGDRPPPSAHWITERRSAVE